MIPDFSTLEMQTLHSESLENVKGEAFNTPEQIDVFRHQTFLIPAIQIGRAHV